MAGSGISSPSAVLAAVHSRPVALCSPAPAHEPSPAGTLALLRGAQAGAPGWAAGAAAAGPSSRGQLPQGTACNQEQDKRRVARLKPPLPSLLLFFTLEPTMLLSTYTFYDASKHMDQGFQSPLQANSPTSEASCTPLKAADARNCCCCCCSPV